LPVRRSLTTGCESRTPGSTVHLQTGLPGIVAVTTLFGGVFIASSNSVALVTRDREATMTIADLLTGPLLFVSSAFLPRDVLPEWIQAVAVLNAITCGGDGIRALMLGQDVLSVFEVTAFGGLWDTVVPAVGAWPRSRSCWAASPCRC
jgi:ABC-2 type transport system permease protein